MLKFLTKAMWIAKDICKARVPPMHVPPHTHGVLTFALGSLTTIPIMTAHGASCVIPQPG